MNDWLKFDPIASGSALLITVLVLFAGFLFLELKRPKRCIGSDDDLARIHCIQAGDNIHSITIDRAINRKL